MNPSFYPWIIGAIFSAGAFYAGSAIAASYQAKKNEEGRANLKNQIDNVARLDRDRATANDLEHRRLKGCMILETAHRLAPGVDLEQLDNLVRRLLMD